MADAVTITVPHVGPRRVETVTSTPRAVMAPTSFWNAPLPPDVLLDVPHNPAVAVELARQAAIADATVNTYQFSAPVTLVPPDQPLVPVAMTVGFSAALTAVFATGLPILDGFVPEDDTDGEAVFYQPDYVGPAGHRGRLYEAWKLRKDTAGDWLASWGGRMVNTHANPGYWTDWKFSGHQYSNPGHPDSTYMEKGWGATATSLPNAAGTITREDVLLGRVEHAVGLAVIYARQGTRWPAQRNDGIAGHASPILEGMRLRFPPGHVWSGHPVAELVHDAARDYGLVVWDKAGALSVRAEPSVQEFFDGTPGYDVLDGFPWQDLQVLAAGSSATPNPVA